MNYEIPMKSFEELMSFSPTSPFCLFTYWGSNLGDNIQTLALLQHVTPKMLVPRNHLTPQKDLCLLANGWLSNGKLPNKDDFRSVKYVGVFIKKELRNIETINAMKGCGVIGCRDSATAAFLNANGIPSHVTRCATLTFPHYHGKREGIICVDIHERIKEKVLQIFKDSIFVTHDVSDQSQERSLREGFGVSENIIMNQYKNSYTLLTQYMKAELVITSRLHVTLPCVAFGTPVIYTGDSIKQDDRITALDGIGVKNLNWKLFRLIPSWALRKPSVVDASIYRERYLDFLQSCIVNFK